MYKSWCTWQLAYTTAGVYHSWELAHTTVGIVTTAGITSAWHIRQLMAHVKVVYRDCGGVLAVSECGGLMTTKYVLLELDYIRGVPQVTLAAPNKVTLYDI